MPARFLNDIFKKIDAWLTAIDGFIWPSEQNVDFTSTALYVFKAFPKNLKGAEIKQWALLQTNTLSPFSNGDHYQYLSQLGLHLWVSNNSFFGIPETATQDSLRDGEYLVKGKNNTYQQHWFNSIMLDCATVSIEADSPNDKVDNIFGDKTNSNVYPNAIPLMASDNAWAVPRKIDTVIKKPTTWLAINFFVILCGLLWGLAGFTTIHLQNRAAENNISVLTDSLGEKLQQQNRLRSNEQLVSTLEDWQYEYGFFPETFAAVAEKLTFQGNWQVNTLTWQNKTLELEFVSNDMNITTLVGDLELIDILQQVNIRPHNADNTWILEARLK